MKLLDIAELEQPSGVVVSVGGQTPNNLAMGVHKHGIKIVVLPSKQLMPVRIDTSLASSAIPFASINPNGQSSLPLRRLSTLPSGLDILVLFGHLMC